MQEQVNQGYSPQETRLEQINIGGLFNAYIKSDYFRSHYKNNSQLLYASDLKRLLKLSSLIGQFEVDRLPKLIDELKKSEKTPRTIRTISAIRSAAAWGVAEGLLDENQYTDTELKQQSAEPQFSNYNIIPLSTKELEKLKKATDKSPRDKALILTILLARVDVKTIINLTTESIIRDVNGSTSITFDQLSIPVPDETAPALLNYVKNLRPGPLFPSRMKSKKLLTRQAMHIIFQKYKEEIGLSKLNHSILVRTGIREYGQPTKRVNESGNF